MKKIKNLFRKTLYLTTTINKLFKQASYLTEMSESEIAREILENGLNELINKSK